MSICSWYLRVTRTIAEVTISTFCPFRPLFYSWERDNVSEHVYFDTRNISCGRCPNCHPPSPDEDWLGGVFSKLSNNGSSDRSPYKWQLDLFTILDFARLLMDPLHRQQMLIRLLMSLFNKSAFPSEGTINLELDPSPMSETEITLVVTAFVSMASSLVGSVAGLFVALLLLELLAFPFPRPEVRPTPPTLLAMAAAAAA